VSYDIDILATSEDGIVAAKNSLIELLSKRPNYEVDADQVVWTFGSCKDGFTIDLVGDEDRANFEPEQGDDPRTIAWLSFNYMRGQDYYVAVANELDAILSIPSVNFYDPQIDGTWVDGIDRAKMFGITSDVDGAFERRDSSLGKTLCHWSSLT